MGKLHPKNIKICSACGNKNDFLPLDELDEAIAKGFNFSTPQQTKSTAIVNMKKPSLGKKLKSLF